MSYVADDNRYSTIQYARSGRSGLMLPRISLGLWNNFGDDRPFDVQRAIVRRCRPDDRRWSPVASALPQPTVRVEALPTARVHVESTRTALKMGEP